MTLEQMSVAQIRATATHPLSILVFEEGQLRRLNMQHTGSLVAAYDVGNKSEELRDVSVISFAFSCHSGKWYWGHSGGGGDFSYSLSSQSVRNDRMHNVQDHLALAANNPFNLPAPTHGRPPENCAEVSALNYAIESGESDSDLIFMAWKGSSFGGQLMDPCNNCKNWMFTRCYGCIGEDGWFYRQQLGGLWQVF